jgi:signal transduction histidine kinase
MTRVYTNDVSMEQRLEALQEQNSQLSRIIAELRNQDALKTQFLANISHDLRTPLTAVITHAEILRDGILGTLNERQAESIAGIISGGRQLLDMVGEILTYARGAANQLTLARSEFTVEAVVEQVCAMSESLIAKKEHVLSVDIAPGLPPLYADREKVAHVLGNLLGNAIDFTPPRGRVWIAVREGGSVPRGGAADAEAREERGGSAGGVTSVEIEVGDSGIGIAPEHHDLVFREFAQVDASASRQHHGTGLGLAIARKFVELHDGRIWLESKLGAGSRFFFTIPVRVPPASAAPSPTPSSSDATSPPSPRARE